jgi:hypothetical protein
MTILRVIVAFSVGLCTVTTISQAYPDNPEANVNVSAAYVQIRNAV